MTTATGRPTRFDDQVTAELVERLLPNVQTFPDLGHSPKGPTFGAVLPFEAVEAR